MWKPLAVVLTVLWIGLLWHIHGQAQVPAPLATASIRPGLAKLAPAPVARSAPAQLETPQSQSLAVAAPPPARNPPKSLPIQQPPPPASLPRGPQIQPQLPQPQAYPNAQALASNRSYSNNFVQRAQESGANLADLLQRGKLRAQFVGTGASGPMVSLQLFNPGPRAIQVSIVPGMILRPPDGLAVQPLLIEDELKLTLQPGQSVTQDLYSFCMDSRVPAPWAGQLVDYVFANQTKDGGAATVAVLEAARKKSWSRPELRRPIVQVAIWKSLHQPVGHRQLQSLGLSPQDTQLVVKEAEKLLEASRR